ATAPPAMSTALRVSARRRRRAGLAVLALVGFAVAAFGAQDGLVDGNRAARAGIEQVNDGNYLEAADRFDEAAAQFADADGSLSAVWTQPARLLPVVAQHRAAGADLAQTAAEASADLAAALRSVNVDDLRILNGRFDLGSLALVEQPFLDVQASFDQLRATIGDVESPWLIEPVQDRLDALAVELDDIEPTLANAVDAVQLAPQLLGADGERTYFLAFTTPAEARGLGGFMGNYAVITADDGALQLVDFGRTGDLNRALDLPGTVSGPDEWLDRYGQYGFTSGPNGGTERFPWSNVTISPDFPSTAEVISELYTQSGGTELDGVFAMDPYVLRELMQLTGPVTVADTGEQLNANNVLDFLLVEQYEIDATDDRVDLLEDVSREVVQRVLRGDLPGPVQVADALSPMAAQGRLVGWSADPDEQDLFERVRLAGGLPDLAGGDGVALVVTNAGANKLDVYLERTLDYAAVVDQRSGQVTGELTVTLHNQAPSDGLPNGVIGNYRGDARGTNRILVSLYTALPLDEVTVGDGEAVNPQLGTEGGWITNSFFVGVPPGGTIDITATVAGVLAIPDGYTLATRPQPLVIPETQRLRVTDLDGKTLIDVDGTAEEPQVYSVGDIDAT
ncbi:MAG: DUF4012 domain-containing protein, partial [Actinomycetota bacterium]